jgi:hypothetical protein
MTQMLYPLGRAAVRNRCVVVLIWIVVAIVTIGAARAIGAIQWARGSHLSPWRLVKEGAGGGVIDDRCVGLLDLAPGHA